MDVKNSKRRELLIVSNRLPVTLSRNESGFVSKASAGGLATALSGVQSDKFQWVGWPGISIESDQRQAVTDKLVTENSCVPVFLSDEQAEQFYNRFSNGVLWPLFHYLPEYTDFDLEGWTHYKEVNRLFADRVAELYTPDTIIWIHDYQLMLLPSMLRERIPDAKIGFFLHIPFPSSEVYRLLPVRTEILQGLLGSDVIGFHTYDYARHFRSACMRVLGCDSLPQYVEHDGYRSRLAVSPIGIDIEHFENLVDQPDTQKELASLRQKYEFEDCKVILGVDRLDYSKGLRHKLLAFERFLEKHPEYRNRLILIQVAVPSRTEVDRYISLRREIEEMVGHINGLYSGIHYTPVNFLFQGVSQTTLSALYQLADVCWVSPVRDGMNLVCHEYVISKKDCTGALVLSEFAGAARGLRGALRVNPWNTEQMADSVYQALEMTPNESDDRMTQMRESVAGNSSADWAHRFVGLIEKQSTGGSSPGPRKKLLHNFDELVESFKKSRHRYFLLDCDGTLTSFAPTPEEAVPKPEVLELLKTINGLPNTSIYIVSGRPAVTLEAWFGAIDLGICAEHGQKLREPGSDEWIELVPIVKDWMVPVERVMRTYSATVPGALVEPKEAALAWHWRRCDPEFGQWQANELAFHLSGMLSNQPAEVIHGHKVIEVRSQGLNKGALMRHLKPRLDPSDFILSIGDDRTDEDLFEQLPETAWSCRVGKQPTKARYYVDRQPEVPRMLQRLLESINPPTPQTQAVS